MLYRNLEKIHINFLFKNTHFSSKTNATKQQTQSHDSQKLFHLFKTN